MKKKVFTWLVSLSALAVCLCLLPAKAQATQVEYLEPIQSQQAGAPLEFAATPVAEEAGYVTTKEEAAAVLREQLKDRKEYAVINWRTLSYSDDSFYEMFDLAVAHTGNPTEGDYISRNYANWSAQLSGYVMGNVYYLTLEYNISYYANAEQEAKVDLAVAEILEELDLWNATDYQKVKGVYDWLCQNVAYDYAHLDDSTYSLKYSTYAALVDRTAVAQGYATAMYRLLLELGVDVRYVGGWSYDNNGQQSAHGWNIVKLGQVYYNVDVTWDAVYTQSGYAYHCFLKSDTDFTYHMRNDTMYAFVNTSDYPMATISFYYEAAEEQETIPPELTFTLNEDGESYSVTYCDESASGEMIIPSTYNGKPVTAIGDYAFFWCDSLTSVTIPNSVTTIGRGAFDSCKSLTSVTIPDSVSIIGDYAFSYCVSLTNVTIPDNVTTIGMFAFDYCYDLTSVTIGNSVSTIEDYAFYFCTSLTSVTIPNNVNTIGVCAFSGCSSLTGIWVDEKNSNYSSDDVGALLDKDQTVLICVPGGFANYHIPESVTTIDAWAFSYCDSLTSVTIGDSVITIGDCAFAYCTGLTSVTILDGVAAIGDAAFSTCYSLTSVTIPGSVTTIGNWTFYKCNSLTSVTMGDSVTTIGDYAFRYCNSLSNVYYDGTEAQRQNISIGNRNDPLLAATWHYAEAIPVELSFLLNEDGQSYSVTGCVESASGEMIIPATYDGKPVTAIGDWVFNNCKSLTSVTIPDSVTNLGAYAFYRCESLTSVTIPNGVTTIGNATFCCCYSLTSVIIPDSVTTIGDSAFIFCESLISVTIPDSVTTIGYGAFYGCNSLYDVYYGGTEAQRQNITIGSDNDPLLSATWHYTEEEAGVVGDFTGDEKVNNEDVVYLLWHIMFPENYPVESQADFTGDNKVNNEDVIYLLWHIMFPESYPLTVKEEYLV